MEKGTEHLRHSNGGSTSGSDEDDQREGTDPARVPGRQTEPSVVSHLREAENAATTSSASAGQASSSSSPTAHSKPRTTKRTLETSSATGKLNRREAVPYIKRWLAETVEEREGGSLLKRELFEDYLLFCMRSDLSPTNDATFGRIVNSVFPKVQQRRLRRESHIKKWHYCGIAYRVTSQPDRGSMTATASALASHAPPVPTPLPSELSSHHPLGQDLCYSAFVPAVQHPHELPYVTTHDHRHNPLPHAAYPPFSHPPQFYHPSSMPYHPLSSNVPTSFVPERQTQLPYEYHPLTTSTSIITAVPKLKYEDHEEYQRDPRELSSRSLRDDSNHLSFLSQLRYFASYYRNEMWGLEPLNPLCLKLDTLRYIFTTSDGAAERTPLSLSTHYALCAGALLSGHLTQAKQYFAVAREHLGYVFDHTDYDVASVLCYMTMVARFFAQSERDGEEQSQYYITLAIKICERIGAFNDHLYSMLVKHRHLFLGGDSYENTLKQAKMWPRWQLSWKRGKVFIEHYKLGGYAHTLANYVLENVNGVTNLLAQENKQRERWLQQEEACRQAEEAIHQVEFQYGCTERRPLTTFLRFYVYLCRALCHLRLKLEARQAAEEFIYLLSSCNPGMMASLVSEIWWLKPLAEALIELIAFLQLHGHQDLVGMALTALETVSRESRWASVIYDSVRLTLGRTTAGETSFTTVKREKAENEGPSSARDEGAGQYPDLSQEGEEYKYH